MYFVDLKFVFPPRCLKDLKTEFVRELNQRYGKSYRI